MITSNKIVAGSTPVISVMICSSVGRAFVLKTIIYDLLPKKYYTYEDLKEIESIRNLKLSVR